MDLYKTVDIARMQLETAIRLFFLGEDYFSVVTLAGASEEIYGRILQLLGKEPALHARARTTRILHDALLNEEISEDEYRKNANTRETPSNISTHSKNRLWRLMRVRVLQI